MYHGLAFICIIVAAVFILTKQGLCSRLYVHISLPKPINNICTYVCVCVVYECTCLFMLFAFYVLITVVGISYINNHY